MLSPSARLTATIMPRNHNNKLTNGLNVGIPVVPQGGTPSRRYTCDPLGPGLSPMEAHSLGVGDSFDEAVEELAAVALTALDRRACAGASRW